MRRFLTTLCLAIAACLLSGIASAQVERDTNSRSRAGMSGHSRDVFSSGVTKVAPQVPETTESFALPPIFESSAFSIAFSIKGTARDVGEIVNVSYPEPEHEPSVDLLADSGSPTDDSEDDRGNGSLFELLSGLTGDDAPKVPADDPALADSALDETSSPQKEGETDDSSADESGDDGLVSETDESEKETTGPRVPLLSFGDFPEHDGGTSHDVGDDQPEEDATDAPASAAPTDEPELETRQITESISSEAGTVEEPATARSLSAGGKPSIRFGETAGFHLPADGEQEPLLLPPPPTGAAPTGGHAAGVMTIPWHEVTIPSGMTTISRGNPRQRQVALTFDDGPHPEYTAQILSILEYYDVPATFFFVGIQCVKHPQWVELVSEKGHEIGSQTYDHFRMPKLPKEEKEYQIDEYQLLIKRLCGAEPRFLRPPGGQVDDQTKELLKKRGIVLAMWDVALNDTRDGKTADEMLATAKKQIRPGSVILAHDGVKATVDVLPQLIEELRRQGYEFVTMSQLAAGL